MQNRFYLAAIFLIFFSAVALNGHAEEGFEIHAYYPYDYNISAQDDYKNLDFSKGQTGFGLQLKSPYYIGLGISLYQKHFGDKTTDINYKINNYFFDVTYKLPVPEFLNLTVGVGVGQSELSCDNQACKDLYSALNYEQIKTNSFQYFLNLGFKVGYIYKLNFGYSRLSVDQVKFINKNTRDTLFEIKADSNVYMIGLSIMFK